MHRDKPFILSDITEDNYCQRLTEVNYCMSSLYPSLYPIVNEKGVSFFVHFKTSYIFTPNKLEYISSFQLMIDPTMNLIITNPTNKEVSDILCLHLQNKYPRLCKKSQQALLKLIYFYDCSKIIHTSNQQLQMLFSCNKRNAQKITQELAEYGIIKKDLPSCNEDISCESENTLHISINLPNISGIKFKQTEFLATYLRTETLCSRGMSFKVAVFKEVHDLDNVITIKSDRIGYDDETSNFLKKLNAGDVISFTPSIHKPTFKGIKYPLNLKIHTKTETEDNMTFFAEFDRIEEHVHEKFGLIRCAWFTHIANTDFSIMTPVAMVSLEANCLNSQSLEPMEEGDLIVFKAKVGARYSDSRKVHLDNINNIMPRDEYYNYNYRATA